MIYRLSVTECQLTKRHRSTIQKMWTFKEMHGHPCLSKHTQLIELAKWDHSYGALSTSARKKNVQTNKINVKNNDLVTVDENAAQPPGVR